MQSLKYQIISFLLIPMMLISSCRSQRELTGLRQDPQTASMIRLGKDYLSKGEYGLATSVLNEASNRPFNQSTTAAVYLAGLAYYRQGDQFRALQKFNSIIQRFPKSKYAADAKYHRALGLLRHENDLKKQEGVLELANIYKSSRNTDLSDNAENAFKQFMFYEASSTLIQSVYDKLDPELQPVAIEALSYKLTVEGNKEAASELYENHIREGGKSSRFVQDLMDAAPFRPENADIINITLMLPLNLDNPMIDFLEEIPNESRPWLDFYEGFLKSVEQFEQGSEKRVYLKVIDTKADSFHTALQMFNVEQQRPNIIVGGYNAEVSKMVSDWAEEQRIPYINPFSYDSTLTSEKRYTFLTNPSIDIQGANMAQYAYEQLGLKKVAIWSNQKSVTEQLAKGFATRFDTLGGETGFVYIDSIFDEEVAMTKIPQLVNRLKNDFYDGVYIPINRDEVSSNLILSIMKREGIEAIVMGSPRWRNYNFINRDLKEVYQLHFTTSSIYNEEDPTYKSFYVSYLKDYYYPPSVRNMQGFDIGNYAISLIDQYPFTQPFIDYIAGRPKFKGLQLSYDFSGRRINQYVNIAKFANGGIEWVNNLDYEIPSNVFDLKPKNDD